MEKTNDSVIRRALGLIYPRDIKCIVCDGELDSFTPYGVCDSCVNSGALKLNSGGFCAHCGKHLDIISEYCTVCRSHRFEFLVARSSLLYEGDTARLIQNLKYNGRRYLAKYLASFMADSYKAHSQLSADVITFVPLSARRQSERGYNQAFELARALGEMISLPLVTSLKRLKETAKQTALTLLERLENVSGCFEFCGQKEFIYDKRVLLVDDVLTTGATSNECARVLKMSGAKSVCVLVVASPQSLSSNLAHL